MGLSGGAWLVSTALPSMLESRLPAWLPGQVRGSAEGSAWWGPLPRTRLAWRPHPGPVPRGLSHGHPGGCTGPVFPAEASGGFPTVSLPYQDGVLPQHMGFPSPMAPSSLGAPCPHCVCWGAGGDSWGVRKPGPGFPLLGGGCWERCFSGTSMVPGGRAGWGGSHSALYPQIRSPRTLNTPARPPPLPVSENRRRQLWRPPGGWSLASRPRWCWGLWGQDHET